MNFCNECGSKLNETSKFCPECGHTIEKTTTSSSPTEQGVVVSDSASPSVSAYTDSPSFQEAPASATMENPPFPAVKIKKTLGQTLGSCLVFLYIILLIFNFFLDKKQVVMNTVKSGGLPIASISAPMETFFNRKLTSCKWSDEKISKGVYHVYLTGYSPTFETDIKLTFYCEEEEDDMVSYTLTSVTSMDDGTVFSEVPEILFILEGL